MDKIEVMPTAAKTSKPVLESVASLSLSAISPGLADILLSPTTSAAGSAVFAAASEEASPSTTRLRNIDLGNLFQWILCFAIVDFNLETGHALEYSFPPIPFSESERKTLCFSAFPDSNSSEHSGDTIFHFRMRNGAFTQKLYLKTSNNISNNDTQGGKDKTSSDQVFDSAKDTGLPIDTDGYTYGHVFFRQQKDLDVKRGFFQKALVLLTPHPWPGLFSFIISKLGPSVMNILVSSRHLDIETPNGVKDIKSVNILESVCFEIASWPSPPFAWTSEQFFECMVIQIRLMEKDYRVSFPPSNQFPQLFPVKTRVEVMQDFEQRKAILCNPGRFYQLFSDSLHELWTCWELMVLGESIYILADSPTSSSQIVQSMIELIKPIPFGGDFRPYFTIQDADFTSLTNKNRSPPQATLLGVTNRVFSKVLENWPNFVSTSKEKKVSQGMEFLDLETLSLNGVDFHASGVECCSFKHKSYFSKDRKLLQSILEVGVKVKGVESINNTLRQHFTELSQRFLQPLNKYFDTLVVGSPTDMSLSRLRPYPEVKPFRRADFLKYIETHVPSLPLAAKRPTGEFYGRFLNSPNFASWLSQKTSAAYRHWRNFYLKLLSNSDIEYWFEVQQTDSMVECVDLLMRLREEIARYASFFVVNGGDVKHSFSSAKMSQSYGQSTSPSRTSSKPILAKEKSISLPILESRGSLSSFDDFEEEGGGVDLTALSSAGKQGKHTKAQTNPLPSQPNNDEDDIDDKSQGLVYEVMPNLSAHMPKTSEKSLRGIGDFIPSIEQYQSLLQQLDLLIRLLPPEFTMT